MTNDKTSFEDRLVRYKKEEDFFLVDIWKTEDGVYETKHDLTWADVRKIISKAKKNDRIYRVDVLVEDWDGDDDCLFKDVESLVKEPYQWRIELPEFKIYPVKWKGEKHEKERCS